MTIYEAKVEQCSVWIRVPYTVHPQKKIVTSSSRKSKLIGVVDIMLNILWCRNFMESQSYYAEDVYVYQDSPRSILLKTNKRK